MKYEFPFRSTRLGALTKAIVICTECKKVLQPSRTQRSKTGNHGTDFYIHEHPVIAVVLEQSNSGKRSISVPDELSEIRDLLEMTWLYENSDVGDVVNAVNAYLMSKS